MTCASPAHFALVAEYTRVTFRTVRGSGNGQAPQSIGRSPPGPAEAAPDDEGKARSTLAAITVAVLPHLLRSTQPSIDDSLSTFNRTT
ncbi:hypothetical protein GCM10027161_64640 [Microbispora hainanensis]